MWSSVEIKLKLNAVWILGNFMILNTVSDKQHTNRYIRISFDSHHSKMSASRRIHKFRNSCKR
jgi:hypothetical protein